MHLENHVEWESTKQESESNYPQAKIFETSTFPDKAIAHQAKVDKG